MNLPTKITVTRLLLIPVFVTLFMINFPYHYLISAIVFAVATLTDFLDGYLARKNNMVTTLGKFLDSAADKLLVSSALILLMLLLNGMPIALIVVITICVVIIICRELLISCFRQLAAAKDIIMAADKLGKYKAACEFISLIMLLPFLDFYAINQIVGKVFFYIGLTLLIISTILAIISAINYIIKYKQVFKDNAQ